MMTSGGSRRPAARVGGGDGASSSPAARLLRLQWRQTERHILWHGWQRAGLCSCSPLRPIEAAGVELQIESQYNRVWYSDVSSSQAATPTCMACLWGGGGGRCHQPTTAGWVPM